MFSWFICTPFPTLLDIGWKQDRTYLFFWRLRWEHIGSESKLIRGNNFLEYTFILWRMQFSQTLPFGYRSWSNQLSSGEGGEDHSYDVYTRGAQETRHGAAGLQGKFSSAGHWPFLLLHVKYVWDTRYEMENVSEDFKAKGVYSKGCFARGGLTLLTLKIRTC